MEMDLEKFNFYSNLASDSSNLLFLSKKKIFIFLLRLEREIL